MHTSNFYYYNSLYPAYTYSPVIKYQYERSYMYGFGSGLSIIWMVLIIGSYLKVRAEYFLPYCMIFFTSFMQTVIYAINTFLRHTDLLYVGE